MSEKVPDVKPALVEAALKPLPGRKRQNAEDRPTKATKGKPAVEKDDPVNHPSHYTSSPAVCTCGRPIECIDVVRHQNFNRGNALKYVWRAGSKDDEIQDLQKALWYLNDEIARLKKERDET